MDNNNLVRILCLVKNDRINQISTVESLMSTDFPTIWLEYTSQKGAKFLIGGFYRVWTNAGITTEAEQLKRLKILNQQMELATEQSKRVIMLGDANVCAIKWSEKIKKKNNVADSLKNKIEECGLINLELGTFTSDIVQPNGNIATTAIDHIYW